jgi:hypothetical protein
MKSTLALLVVCLSSISLIASPHSNERKPKPGPLTGTWECQSHGSSQGDLPFTLLLVQSGATITGSVESPIGGTDIASASFKNKSLAIKIETAQGDYLLTAQLKNGKLSGEWSHDPEKGTWQGTKQDPSNDK